jgi:DNA-binding response OmpR family regulator
MAGFGEREGSRQLSKSRVLIVEDEPNIVESLNFILGQAGFDVETAVDGAEALQRLRRQVYSALILDLMLPGINGFDVLRSVRSDGELKDMPVIVLTAKGQAADRQAAEAIGATAFITKPFSNAEIVQRVSELTGG